VEQLVGQTHTLNATLTVGNAAERATVTEPLGPILQNRTFFYADFEGLRQHLGQTQIGLVPSPGFISQAQADSPAVAPILSAYPRGTSPTSNSQIWNYILLARRCDLGERGHILKFRVETVRIEMNQGNSQNGALSYLSLNNLSNNALDSATYTAELPLKRLCK
jgi:hypothetical protein